MAQLVNTFFSPKGVIIAVCAFVYLCFMGVNAIHFMDRYEIWSDVYDKKLFYNQQPTCRNSTIKAKLERENKCDENAVFLKTPVWRRALLDVMEGIYICSGGTCQQWFNQLMILVLLSGVFISYVFIRHTAWAVEKTNEIKNSLPYLFGPDIPQKRKIL